MGMGMGAPGGMGMGMGGGMGAPVVWKEATEWFPCQEWEWVCWDDGWIFPRRHA